MRTYASAEERAAKNQKTTVRHFGFTEKVYGLPCTVRTILLWKGHHRNAIVRLSFFLRGAIAVEARRRRATSASIIICMYIYISVKMAAPWGSLNLLSYYSLCPHLRSH